METTKNELPQNIKNFFYHLSEYLDTKFLYFGSVQRSDYIPGKSDIDIDVFTDNEYSLMTKMQHYLHVSKKDFKKVAWIIKDTPIYGYKLQYQNKKENINAEFSIYNEKFKDVILAEHNSKKLLPFYVTFILYILKFFYYQFPILDKKTYDYLKRILINNIVRNGEDAKFLVLHAK
jgi:hypothetical protein